MIQKQNKSRVYLVAAASFGLTLAAMNAATLPALAQTAEETEQAVEENTYIASTHGDWTIRCVGSPPSEDGSDESSDGKGDLQSNESGGGEDSETLEAPQCVMVQVARHTESDDIGISIIIVRQRVNDEMVSQMRITTPISVYLPAMVGLEIDGTAIGRLPYEVCSPAGVCVATSFIDQDLEDKLKRGGEANFFLKDVRGTDGVFKLSLTGFTAAYEELEVPGS